MLFFQLRRFVAGKGDFIEGVRALLVDRGRKPAWKYSSVHHVPQQIVQSFFEHDLGAADGVLASKI